MGFSEIYLFFIHFWPFFEYFWLSFEFGTKILCPKWIKMPPNEAKNNLTH
jgi:hypothetical protein